MCEIISLTPYEKKSIAGRFFLRAVKALVMVTLSDSFRMWPHATWYLSTTLWRDFQKDAEQFAFPHNRLMVDRPSYRLLNFVPNQAFHHQRDNAWCPQSTQADRRTSVPRSVPRVHTKPQSHCAHLSLRLPPCQHRRRDSDSVLMTLREDAGLDAGLARSALV